MLGFELGSCDGALGDGVAVVGLDAGDVAAGGFIGPGIMESRYIVPAVAVSATDNAAATATALLLRRRRAERMMRSYAPGLAANGSTRCWVNQDSKRSSGSIITATQIRADPRPGLVKVRLHRPLRAFEYHRYFSNREAGEIMQQQRGALMPGQRFEQRAEADRPVWLTIGPIALVGEYDV